MGMLLLIVIGIMLVTFLAGFMAGAPERGLRERRLLLFAPLVPVVVLVLWLAVMVLGVGPALHGL
jgi:hypothetical protein